MIASRLSKVLFYLLLFPAIIGVCGWQGWAWWSWASAPALAQPAADPDGARLQVQIPEGTSAQQIGQDLQSIGLIRSTAAWSLWTRWQSLHNRSGGYQAGIYELSPTDSLPTLAQKIWQGQVVERSFTIPEGWSTRQMARYFQDQGLFSADAFLAAVRQVPRDRFPWLPEGITQVEGFLYPDTYQLTEGSKPEDIVNQMLTRFEQTALPVYQKQKGKTPYTLQQWVTLASIVEKEAVVSAERPQIASVFARRLRQNIPLGADPTVEYALGIQQTREQPLTLAQVQTPSDYNTYLNPGLPPTPIASPGLASLEAAIAPADTPYLYFVAKYDGTHVFSRTLEEHEAAQTAIRSGVENQSKPSPAKASAPKAESSPAEKTEVESTN